MIQRTEGERERKRERGIAEEEQKLIQSLHDT
jgi:hypothetical protein